VVYRNLQGTFTRSVTAGFVVALIIMLMVRGKTTLAVPYYGIGVFMPIMVMGMAVRKHIMLHEKARKRAFGLAGASLATGLAALVFVGQIIGKWTEGGWVVLITFSILILAAHILLISPIGYRSPTQIHRIVRDKARVQGAMASIVEWQSLKMQEYRYHILLAVTHFFEIFGVRRPVRFEPVPIAAGDYDDAVHVDHPEAPSILANYLDSPAEPSSTKPPEEKD
jgi:hypothetical protein